MPSTRAKNVSGFAVSSTTTASAGQPPAPSTHVVDTDSVRLPTLPDEVPPVLPPASFFAWPGGSDGGPGVGAGVVAVGAVGVGAGVVTTGGGGGVGVGVVAVGVVVAAGDAMSAFFA